MDLQDLDRHITGNYGEDQYGDFTEEYEDQVFNGLWIIDEDDNMIIIPDGDMEISGIMDAETEYELNRICREKGMPDESDLSRLGYTEVPQVLHRWTPEDGYYHA